jgi:hypothetical protein
LRRAVSFGKNDVASFRSHRRDDGFRDFFHTREHLETSFVSEVNGF